MAKRLRLLPFASHSALGLLRDRTARRWAMFVLLIAAMVLVFGGTTFFEPALSVREHPFWFLLFWLTCAWLTVTALLLALFDLLMVRRETRAQRQDLQRKLED